MAERSDIGAFALEIAQSSAISATAGLAVASLVDPVRHVILAQSEPWIAIVAVLVVGAIVGASVAAITASCPFLRARGE